ncbi:hypothetical protein F2Q69_00003346 [Brassica cretica]|uniref:Uncharacterized protein n=1 Tax=Brassica cretica TaxID=69181 RepID=A0A8S9P3F2_BRACR|nr:hypothetical protein F2Q69_00003346 [Brassica cretica]
MILATNPSFDMFGYLFCSSRISSIHSNFLAADGSLVDGFVFAEPFGLASLFELLCDVFWVVFVVHEGDEGRCSLRGCGDGGGKADVRGGGGVEAVSATEEKARKKRHRFW